MRQENRGKRKEGESFATYLTLNLCPEERCVSLSYDGTQDIVLILRRQGK